MKHLICGNLPSLFRTRWALSPMAGSSISQPATGPVCHDYGNPAAMRTAPEDPFAHEEADIVLHDEMWRFHIMPMVIIVEKSVRTVGCP